VLNELFSNLANIGIQPYYVFACRPTEGNKAFAVPVEQAYEIYEKARMKNSGLAKTARFVMSHRSGKIEVVGLTEKLIMLKYHNVVDHARNGSVFFCQRNPEAYWFDDYKDMEVDIDQAVAALLPQPQ
jgi:L-lysine 2,3-aminomutase